VGLAPSPTRSVGRDETVQLISEEQLKESINEICQRVVQSTVAVNEAISETTRTKNNIVELENIVQKIGDVVELGRLLINSRLCPLRSANDHFCADAANDAKGQRTSPRHRTRYQ
jgi:hypothetical protein